ncbi:uncharacterized protein B0H64DRAFT_434719 [Chaetomium fimeti]|uniref:Pathway-specific nitrogen regulator n=1 Tax=Chaetomium fimeti TaxID=1854472 RepID=A0AAE0HBT7_9PEZI|nr:hypothetical protein B0H64DRAFT_434719 [Chaetomium fimeti]
MPRKTPDLDLDFNIFVDPSCLSAPMDDETLATMPPSSEEVQAPAVVPDTPDEPAAEVAVEDAERVAEDSTSGAAEEAQEHSAPEADVTLADEAPIEEQPEPEITESETAAEEQEDEDAAQTTSTEEETPGTEDASVPESSTEADLEVTPEPEADEPAPEPEQCDEPSPEIDEPEADTTFDAEAVEEPGAETDPAEEPMAEDYVPEPETEVADTESVEQPAVDEFIAEPQEDELPQEEDQVPEEEEVPAPEVAEHTAASDEPAEAMTVDDLEETNNASDAPQEEDSPEDVDASISQAAEPDVNEEDLSRQRSSVDRKASLRTEALIQAAARAVVAKIEKRKSGDMPQEEDELDNSLVSNDSQDTYVLGDEGQSTLSVDAPDSRRQSSESQARHIPSRSISSDDAGDSSSHNERDDDVFSDRSARSSLYSLDQHDDADIPSIKTPQAKESFSRRDSYASSQPHDHSSARTASNFSNISGLSSYDDPKLTFIPTHRETRMPFRTPSEIRAMQMASPTPSVFSGSSPSRSSTHKHHHHQGPRSSNGGGGGPPSSISRLGSPTVSAQYSPKGRSTPPRFKSARKEAPLVLLHVTLLPLRWVWGDVLNTLDSVLQPPAKAATATTAGEDAAAAAAAGATAPAQLFEPSDPLKTLRDAWRELQDRVGDTVLERGILLPHPQNDYEVLEERLLEALELPLKRRARILECGHYVGPANVPEDGESDDEGLDGAEGKTHWCGMCGSEIRCEDLGTGRVFRVKVYASNGLMRAGAWEACWKEMERVDIEVEPIVELAVQNELEKLAVLQMELEEQRRRELELERMPDPEPERKSDPDRRAASRQQADLAAEAEMESQRGMASSPAPSALQLAMRAATPQPSASNTLVRAGTPAGYGVDASEERRLRDEERMREIYGDMPSTTPNPAPSSDHQQQQQQQPQPQQQQQPQSHPHYQQHQQQHTPPPPLPMLTDGTHHPQDPYRPRPIVLDENAGFLDLLTQAFKVLLRDPKNVAIILLCVFLVVMVKRPGATAGVENQVQVVPQAPVVQGVQGVGQGSGFGQGVGYRVEGFEGFEGGKGEGYAGVGGGAAGEREREVEVGVEVVEAAEEKEVEEPVEVEEKTVVEEVPVVEEAVEQQVVLESREEDVVEAQEVAEPEAREPVPSFELPADVCAPRGPEYPVTLVGEMPAAEVSSDLETEVEQPLTDDAAETNALDNAVTGEEDATTKCDLDSDPNGSDSDALQASTSAFLPGPFVTERTTVRVFETVTQTVRVSVVTQTETVSTVVTAVPQTVEETVFETETVRITVSVPVEEQKKKAKPTKGCQEKEKGWF